MNKDKALEELFLAQKPHFDDSDAFMASLTKRLDAIEYIKQHQEATIRRYKMAMVAAFIAGIISGAFAMVYVLSAPMSAPLITINSQIAILQWLSENSRFITVAVISLLMTFGITALISNIQEIKSMRYSLHGERTTFG
ncbi:MAG: hypothetical protein IJK93_07845 [Muribaculaceae bacterium]|nr:hypothetical protein [Muribaculaceae bacterium]